MRFTKSASFKLGQTLGRHARAVAGIHVFTALQQIHGFAAKTWMAGTSPAMTWKGMWFD